MSITELERSLRALRLSGMGATLQARALAVASHAIKGLAVGQTLDVVCNAPDVKNDLLIWARELGHAVLTTKMRRDDTTMRIRKGR
jgi:TusA-related sulfurtransferase